MELRPEGQSNAALYFFPQKDKYRKILNTSLFFYPTRWVRRWEWCVASTRYYRTRTKLSPISTLNRCSFTYAILVIRTVRCIPSQVVCMEPRDGSRKYKERSVMYLFASVISSLSMARADYGISQFNYLLRWSRKRFNVIKLQGLQGSVLLL